MASDDEKTVLSLWNLLDVTQRFSKPCRAFNETEEDRVISLLIMGRCDEADVWSLSTMYPFIRDSDQGHTHSLLLNPYLKPNALRVAWLKEMSFSIRVSELASKNRLYLTLRNVVYLHFISATLWCIFHVSLSLSDCVSSNTSHCAEDVWRVLHVRVSCVTQRVNPGDLVQDSAGSDWQPQPPCVNNMREKNQISVLIPPFQFHHLLSSSSTPPTLANSSCRCSLPHVLTVVQSQV